MALLLSSCTSVQKQVNKIPSVEFENFSYARTGNVTSTTISATNAKKTQSGIEIEKVKVVTSNPFFGATVEIDGYKRSGK